MGTIETVTASDLMQREVITLNSSAPITEAVQTFEEFNIRGAPVVDDGGNLVGVLSAADIARTVHVQGRGIEAQRGDYYLSDPLDEGTDGSRRAEEFLGKEQYSSELLGAETVGDWMTAKVISVDPESTLKEICELMRRDSIHRVMVVQRSRIQGIVTSFDVVKHLAESL